MRTFILSIAAIAAFLLPIHAADDQLSAGDFGNVQQSPFSGDIYGTTLRLMNTEGSWSGLYHEMIEGNTEQILSETTYDSASKILRFHMTDQDGKDHAGAVKKTRDGILFKLDEKKDEQWIYLRAGNRPTKDYTTAYISAPDVHFKKTASDDISPADILAKIPQRERVILPDFSENTYQNGYVLCEWKGKKGFIDQQFLWPVDNQVITGDKVRFRDKPSTDSKILDSLPAGTQMQIIQPINGEWIEVMCGGKRGFINYKFVSK